MNEEECQNIKVAIVGDGGVGKTSIALKYVSNKFHEEHVTTVGACFLQKEIVLFGKKVKLQLWDTAGQEIFKSLIPMYLRDARAVLVVYDVTDRKSFLNVPLWLDDVYRRAPEEAQITLVCNKTDLKEVQVQPQEGVSLAESRNIPFYEVSAKNGTNISVVFHSTASRVVRSIAAGNSFKEQSISLAAYKQTTPQPRKCCS